MSLFVCGGECLIDSLVSSTDPNAHWGGRGAGAANTPTSSPYPVRSGGQNIFFSSAVSGFQSWLYTRYPGASNVAYFRGYFYLPNVNPTSDNVEIWAAIPTGGSVYSTLLLRSNGTLECAVYNGGSYTRSSTNTLTLSTNTWYGVEVEHIAGVGAKWRVWTEDGGWTTSETVSDASTSQANQQLIGFGTSVGESGFPMFMDDCAFGWSSSAGTYYDDTGTNGVDGRVVRYSPTSDGTHNGLETGDFIGFPGSVDIVTATTTAYSHVDNADMELSTEYILYGTPESGDYVEVAFADESTEDTPRGVNLVLKGTASVDSLTPAVTLHDGTNESAVLQPPSPGSLTQFADSFAFDADLGSGAWTLADVNALMARINYDTDGGGYVNALALEVEWTSIVTEPTLQDVAFAEDYAAGGSLEMDGPTGVLPGDLLVAIISSYHTGNVQGESWSSTGWTVERDSALVIVDNTTEMLQAVLTKVATASEPATYTFTASVAINEVHINILCIRNGTIVALPAPSQASSTNPNPPASGTVPQDVYLAVAVAANAVITSHTPPTGYSEIADGYQSVAVKHVRGITSEDPPAFTASTDNWEAWTILVGPSKSSLYARPDADIATTGWATAPLWSKVDDHPDSPDATVITASSS